MVCPAKGRCVLIDWLMQEVKHSSGLESDSFAALTSLFVDKDKKVCKPLLKPAFAAVKELFSTENPSYTFSVRLLSELCISRSVCKQVQPLFTNYLL